MVERLLALKLYQTPSGSGVNLGEHVELDFASIAIQILFKFLDVLEGVVIIIIGILLVRWLKKYFAGIQVTHERQRTAVNLLEKITSGFLIVVAFTLGLKVIGLDLTLMVSVLTLGISFGLRDVIKNYIAGLLILFKSPFEIGDIVKIRSFVGKIEKIEFQAVTIRTFDRKEVTVHNSDLLTQPITNFSKTQQARLELELMLGYGSDVRRALKIFDRILENYTAVLKTPKYSVVFRSFGDHGVKVLVRFWVTRPCNILKVRSELALQIQEAFDEERLLAPYSREAGLEGMYGMNDARRERLKRFYGQPLLAEIAAMTADQIAVAAPVEEYVDADEPE